MATRATDLHHRIEGRPDGPVLVLSHAMGASMAMWEPQVDGLSRAFRVLRYDHRGHGASPVPAGPYTIADIGGDLLRLLDRLGIDRVSFCGLSLGGMVCIWLAANAAARIDRLVLCCNWPRMLRPEDFAARARRIGSEVMAAVADAGNGGGFTPA